MGNSEFNAGANPTMDQDPIQEGIEILLVASCYRNRERMPAYGPLGLYADLQQPPLTKWPVPNYCE